ncbi:MAG: histidinol dehydrogenase, partial [Pseudomonadota bacterium]
MFTRILALETLSDEQRNHLMTRSETDISDLIEYVTPLTERVRTEGDAAVRALTLEFDKVDLADLPLKVTEVEFDRAEARLSDDVKDAIDLAIANITKVHKDQLGAP